MQASLDIPTNKNRLPDEQLLPRLNKRFSNASLSLTLSFFFPGVLEYGLAKSVSKRKG